MPPLPFPPFKLCPCNSKQPYAQCCGPRLSGEQPAQTPEALMRSRYSAYVLQDATYLLTTWHPTTRPAELEVGTQPQWLGLNVRRAAGDTVSFTARYQERGVRRELRERSTFVQESGKWFYLDGVEG
ncbi:hypothetical protein EHF33_08520 [Deinococcus psychrotolerans]|uniref:UPF0225 protein EHF33_08520 n=1 Tax=Deinococcus psychrotolerans TaxID=2489213 RepID=A0A3G8YJU9_9DEIO|nr:YchJ family metal-binding protein [Deinococcus psychrotolerans]AZI42784.1 hypothetical protein EHF33_08520 [Deinococcus psychrotolerans]